MVGIGVSAAFLYLFFRSTDLGTVLATIGDVQIGWLLPATAIYFVGVWLRAARWRRLVEPFAAVPTARLFSVILIGFAVNNVLPLRLGELVRTFLLRHSHQVPIAATLGSILLERVLDVAVLCGILALASVLVPLDGWLAGLAGLARVVTAGALLGLLGLVLSPPSLLRWAFGVAEGVAGRISARLAGVVRSFLLGLCAVENPRSLIPTAGLSIGCWVAELGLYYFVMLGFGFDSGLVSLAAGMVAANLATVLPSSPGYVGTFDVPLQSTLSDAFGVAPTLASSYTLVTHAVLLVPVVVAGLLLLGREDLSLRALSRGRVEVRRSPTGSPHAPAGSLSE